VTKIVERVDTVYVRRGRGTERRDTIYEIGHDTVYSWITGCGTTYFDTTLTPGRNRINMHMEFDYSDPRLRLMAGYYFPEPRETEICRLVESGATGKEIARALGLSEHTIGKHKERIRKKLGISHLKANLASYLKNPPDA